MEEGKIDGREKRQYNGACSYGHDGQSGGADVKRGVKAKKKYAPNARGTAACGKRSDVGSLLQSGMRKVKCCRIATREENL